MNAHATRLLAALAAALSLHADAEPSITLSCSSDPAIRFAADEIGTALKRSGMDLQIVQNGDASIVLALDSHRASIQPEGFIMEKEGGRLIVTGHDAAGVMYGGLELAEQINLFGLAGVRETAQNPYMERRGTKFNIPLDVRTPSYSDVCDSAQNNILEMWSFDFWKEYIDALARYRYNYVSLWNLHPFPSLISVPCYEDVALEDVQRSKVDWKEFYSFSGVGFDAPEIIGNVETLKKITMAEKIAFWRKVMAYGKERNVDFCIITWNIFVNGTGGKYGITDHIDNPTTRDYFRKSVKQLFITYPDLAGIGLTTGENMSKQTSAEKEDWVYDTYAQGVLDAAAECPGRKFTFIHRQHQTGAQEIASRFKPLIENENIEFLFSFKYAKAHVMSTVTQPYHERFVQEVGDLKTLWTLRNDDNYYFRWGAPGFVREFIANIPHEVSRGFYYGSDQWIWGREFTMKDAAGPRQLEVVKHWYHWMMWGRLGYDPQLPDERFVQLLRLRFPHADAQALFTAWQEASMVYPTTTGFHWGPLDFHWYIEGCKSRPDYAQNKTGFHDVNRFINLPPHPKSGFQSIPDYVKMVAEGKTSSKETPLQVAQRLHGHAEKALELLQALQAGDDRELAATLHDIRTMALLGKYYAHKIAGSTHLALYRQTRVPGSQDAAVKELEKALDFWKQYAAAALRQNINPLWTNRVGHVDWAKTTEWVRQDIEISKEMR